MKLIALEEHMVTPAIMEAWVAAPDAVAEQIDNAASSDIGKRMLDMGDQRLADMDDLGVDVHVLSLTTPGVQNLAPADAVALAREANDAVAAAVARRPD